MVQEQLTNRRLPEPAKISRALRASCEISERFHDGQKIYTLTPRGNRSNLHILYLHGGAYVHPLNRAHWRIINEVMRATGATVTVPQYALAPESDFRTGTALIEDVFDEIVLNRGSGKIVVMGDDAGGASAITLALRRRDDDLILPDRIILLSPWLDLALKSRAIPHMEHLDVTLSIDGLRECGRMWSGPVNPASPYLSPLYSDLSGLPPISIFQGDHDILYIGSRKFVDSAERHAVSVDYFEYKGGYHMFMGVPFFPESKDVYERIKEILSN